MKQILTFLAIILSTASSFSQTKDSSVHLTFKGVPIDGTLEEYVSKMKQSGFSHIGTKGGVAILKGDFASYNNCTVDVSTLRQKNLVSKIAVMFPDRDTWSDLSSNYFNLQELLTEKYGTPTNIVEEFQSYTPRDDGSKMHAVQFDKCKYYTTYETGKGTIQLSIEHEGMSRCFVKLAYFDKINSEKIKKEALDDL